MCLISQYYVYKASRSCLLCFLCHPYIPHYNLKNFNLLVNIKHALNSVFWGLLLIVNFDPDFLNYVWTCARCSMFPSVVYFSTLSNICGVYFVHYNSVRVCLNLNVVFSAAELEAIEL